MKYTYLIICLLGCHNLFGQMYSTINGDVHFISDAPLEIIEAKSSELQGLFDAKTKSFAFKIYIKSFEGFNSPLQQVHFHENYMEVKDYPIAVFKGKILEKIQPGKGKYRAKGILEIHGVKVERIIQIEMNFGENTVVFNSEFIVPLVDHKIDLPRIVYQKIAEEINVTVSGSLEMKE